jgi:anti-anti-sigma factor
MCTVSNPAAAEPCVVRPKGALQVPSVSELGRTLRAIARQGERHIVVDLDGVSAIDAGGIGELVRAHNRMTAADGVFRIRNAGRRVRVPLERVGLFWLLSAS